MWSDQIKKVNLLHSVLVPRGERIVDHVNEYRRITGWRGPMFVRLLAKPRQQDTAAAA